MIQHATLGVVATLPGVWHEDAAVPGLRGLDDVVLFASPVVFAARCQKINYLSGREVSLTRRSSRLSSLFRTRTAPARRRT